MNSEVLLFYLGVITGAFAVALFFVTYLIYYSLKFKFQLRKIQKDVRRLN